MNTRVWRTGNVIGIVLLVLTSYEMGVGQARYKKRASEYFALTAQYNRIKTEYSALKAQHARIEVECSALKTQYDRILAQKRTPTARE
jgi:hypothetical protein